MAKVHKTDKEWRETLTDEQYRVLRQKGTEMPFSGSLRTNTKPGEYRCAACGSLIFDGSQKYESTIPTLVGWPSFAEAVPDSLEYHTDYSYGMIRTEISCATCGSHFGHLFEDDSSPSGKHYCVSSVCLDFKPKAE